MQHEQHDHDDDAAEEQAGQHNEREEHRGEEARVGALRLFGVFEVALDELDVATVGLFVFLFG